MTIPRLRPELHATPIEDQGLKFFDISDPRSGGKMRLYDFEWLLASQMDGRRSLDEIARWAHGTLHLEVTGSSLATYAERLAEFGFIAAPEPTAVLPPRDPNALSGVNTPLPPPSPGADTMDGEDVSLEMSPEEDDTVTTKQEALPPRSAPTAPPPASIGFESTKQRPDEKTDRNAQQQRDAAAAANNSAEVTAPPRSGGSSMIWLVVVLLIIAGVVAYVIYFAPGAGNKVSTQVARTREIVALYDGSAKLNKAPARTLSFGETGKVTDVVAAGTEVKAGMPLATLDGFAKVEKEIADVKDRLGYYQKQLDAAASKGEAAQKAAEEKVAEKKKLLADLEARAGKLRLVATGPGVVDKVHVSAGAEAKPDAPAVELTDNRVVAQFKLADAAGLKAGDDATLQAVNGATTPAKISKLDGGDVTVEIGDGASAKAGDEVRLVKSRLPGVVVVPTAAVVKKGGADTVFVLMQDVVHAKKVTIADRSGTEVYVSAGLAAGDQIVTSGGDALNDGDKASAAQ